MADRYQSSGRKSIRKCETFGGKELAVREGYGIEKSSVSREFVAASAAQLKKLCEKRLDGLDLVTILIDGIHLGKQVLVVALGIEIGGKKHVLGLWQGATENTASFRLLLAHYSKR
jgi:putative transposase